MHDIDRTASEFGMGSGEFQTGETPFGYETFPEMGFSGEMSSPFNEVQETEMAAELLSLNNEAELNYFLGDLIKKAGGAVGSIVSSPTGQALGGLLKTAVKKALPIVGGAIGGYFGGPSGASAGSTIGSAAGNLFGPELETFGPGDRDFEMAKRFVRFGGAATKSAVKASKHVHPHTAAKKAVSDAARQFIPGLASDPVFQPTDQPAPPQEEPFSEAARSGRWIRKGRRIILLGA